MKIHTHCRRKTMKYPEDNAALNAIRNQLGSVVALVNDESPVIAWIKDNFPFPGPGSTCEWTLVPAAKTVSADYDDQAEMEVAFKDLINHVDAKGSDNVVVLWHSAS